MALDLSALRRIIADENRLLTGADIPAEYQSDVLGRVHGSAEALAFPLSTEEVSALLLSCWSELFLFCHRTLAPGGSLL